MQETPYRKNYRLGRADGGHTQCLGFFTFHRSVEETSDYVDAARLDLATSSYTIPSNRGWKFIESCSLTVLWQNRTM